MKLNSGHDLSDTSLLRPARLLVSVVVEFMVVPRWILMFMLVLVEMVDEAKIRDDGGDCLSVRTLRNMFDYKCLIKPTLPEEGCIVFLFILLRQTSDKPDDRIAEASDTVWHSRVFPHRSTAQIVPPSWIACVYPAMNLTLSPIVIRNSGYGYLNRKYLFVSNA
jgi:hypothetical protein